MLLALLCATPLLGACQTAGTAIAEIDGESTLPFCRAASPITYSSRRDTLETVQQIKEHNAVGLALRCRKWGIP